jgi:predicted neuraminidase
LGHRTTTTISPGNAPPRRDFVGGFWGAAFWAALAIAMTLAAVKSLGPRPPLEFALAHQDDGGAPFYKEQFLPLPKDTPQVHSSTLTELPGGNILAAWYGGTHELATDTALYDATFDRAAGQWGPARLLVNREQTAREVHRYIKTLGNPTLMTDPQGRTWLFYVTTSVGGWSSGAVNVKMTCDGGQSWTAARRLVLNPMLNMTTLVRTPAFAYTDGSIALPTYHQGVSKFPELVHLGPSGEVLGKVRMQQARGSLQPSIVATGPAEAVALMRNMGKGITLMTTTTAGEDWTKPVRLNLTAPNSSLMAVRLPDGRLMLAFNNSTRRMNLSVAISSDGGRQWEIVHEFPEGTGAFSYPCLFLASDGMLHLTYSWNRLGIKHIMFNLAWLRAKP